MHIVIEFYRTRDRHDAHAVVGSLLKPQAWTTPWKSRDDFRKHSIRRSDLMP